MRTIAQVSDLHFGEHNPEIVEDLLRSLTQAEPALVALSGDFTQRAKHSEFMEARSFLDRIAFPKLLVPGNHDVPLFNVFARFMRPFARYDRYVAPVSQASDLFRDDELAVLGLNTARRFTRKNGRISHEQMARIQSAFRTLPAGIFKILVTHHPLATPSREASRELAGRSVRAMKAVTDAGVHLAMSGHHHQALSGTVTEIAGAGSVLIVHAGTAVSTRLRRDEGNTYNLVRVTNDTVSVTVMEWVGGKGFVEARQGSYALEGGGWVATG